MTADYDSDYFRVKLKEIFEKRCKKDPTFSLRKFAHQLGLLAPSFSNIINGKRSIPLSSAIRVAERLNLSENEKDKFIKSIFASRNKSYLKRVHTNPFKQSRLLQESKFAKIIVNPEYFVLLSFLSTDYQAKDLLYISHKLGIRPEKAQALLDNLIQASLVAAKDGIYHRTSSAHHTTDNIPSKVIQSAHLQTLKLASDKLQKIPMEHRDFSSIKIPGNVKSLEAVRKEIRRFQRKMFQLMAKDEAKDEVFELAIQLFPHTRIGMQK